LSESTTCTDHHPEDAMKLTCKEAHRLVSHAMEEPLPAAESTRLQLHLAICEACTRFNVQMDLLRRAMRHFRHGD
jgi:hypothetical protein